jgi:rubrerythrin
VEADLREMTASEVEALCTNLQKACTKQHRIREAEILGKIAAFYGQQTQENGEADLAALMARIESDLGDGYRNANEAAKAAADRGALRALVWGEKATKLLKSLLMRYDRQKEQLTEGTNLYVCEICGFVYVGDQPPTVCPICKVPSFKIHPVAREVR